MLINFYIGVLIAMCVDKVKSAYILGWMVQTRPNTLENQLKMNANLLPILMEKNFEHHSNNSQLKSPVVNAFIGNIHANSQIFNQESDNEMDRINNDDQVDKLMENQPTVNRNDNNRPDQLTKREGLTNISQDGNNNYSSIRSGDLANIGLSSEGNLRCKVNSDCLSVQREMYCDNHYGHCREASKEDELCRSDEHCSHNMICIFGKCAKPKEIGKSGSRCLDDSDCDSDHCCARLFGFKICKPRKRLHQKCFVPYGGLDYSLNESCPCVDGLLCEPTEYDDPNVLPFKKMRPKNPRIEHLRCTI